MKYKLALFFLWFAITNLQSQNIDFKKGEIVKDRLFLRDKNEISITDDTGNFYTIRPERSSGFFYNYFVEFYNDVDFTERIKIKSEKKIKILKTFIKNRKIYLFIKEELKKGFSLRFDIIDTQNKSKSQKEVLKVYKKSNPSFYKSLKEDSFIYLDNNANIILSIPVKEDKKTFVFVKVLSKKLETLSEHKIFADDDLSSKYTRYLSTIQFKNKIYFLFNLSLNKKDRIYRLIELKDENKKTLDIPIATNTYELIATKVKNSELIISGLYSKKVKGGFEGVTYYKIGLNTFSLNVQKQSVFKNDKIKNYFKGFFRNNRSIDIKNIFLDEDLNTYLVSQFYIIRRQSIPIGIPIATIGSSVLITFNPISIKYKLYDDLLMCKINNNGDLDWEKSLEFAEIERTSSRSNKKDSSVFAFFYENNINLLVNGYIKNNAKKVIIKQDKRFSKTKFYNVKIDSTGTMYLKTIFSNKDSDIIFRAGQTVLSDNILYNLGQGNMRKQLLKIKF